MLHGEIWGESMCSSKACVAAINDYFGRQEKIQDDPYLETREKEDAFLQRLNDTVAAAIRNAAPALDITGLLKLLQPNAQPVERPNPKRQTEELTDITPTQADSPTGCSSETPVSAGVSFLFTVWFQITPDFPQEGFTHFVQNRIPALDVAHFHPGILIFFILLIGDGGIV